MYGSVLFNTRTSLNDQAPEALHLAQLSLRPMSPRLPGLPAILLCFYDFDLFLFLNQQNSELCTSTHTTNIPWKAVLAREAEAGLVRGGHTLPSRAMFGAPSPPALTARETQWDSRSACGRGWRLSPRATHHRPSSQACGPSSATTRDATADPGT